MKRVKVLMLGWEFPPVINGGLGVACLGLSKALAQKVDLSVIIPKSDPEFLVDQVNLIGLDHLDLNKLKRTETTSFYEEFSDDVQTVDLSIDPYQTSEGEILQSNSKKTRRVEKEIPIPVPDYQFKIDELYGEDKIEKVTEFAKYTAQLSWNLDFDVIHAHDWMTYLAGIEIKAKTGKPLVVHVHSLEHDRSSPETRNWVYYTEKWGMEYADAVIPVSNYTGKVAEKYYEISPSKIHPVHNGVDPVVSFRKTKPFPEKLVVFLGRVTHQKGPTNFLDIAERVLSQMPGVRFVVAGHGDQLRSLIETGAYKHLGKYIHFTGFIDKPQVQELLAMADVYCMPSISEPFGLSALEAVQFGVPCVVTKQSGVSEVLGSALKADYWDIHKLAEHIIDLLKHPVLANNVVHNSYHDLKACTWNHAADQVLEVYKKIGIQNT